MSYHAYLLIKKVAKTSVYFFSYLIILLMKSVKKKIYEFILMFNSIIMNFYAYLLSKLTL